MSAETKRLPLWRGKDNLPAEYAQQVLALAALPSTGEDSEQHSIAKDLGGFLGCNCDLDNWEPERSTGHSWVCRIHRYAVGILRARKTGRALEVEGLPR